MFGVTSKSRFLCIDIQFDEVYFVVVRKVGVFFEIDFIEQVRIEGGVFEESHLRTPGKIRDVLQKIQKKFGILQVLASVPEHFCYATFLPSEKYSSSLLIQEAVDARVTAPSYVWTNTFHKNTSSYIAIHVAEKRACNSLYTLIKTTGFSKIFIYPRALVLSQHKLFQNIILCDFGKKQIGVFSICDSRTVGFSLVPYGSSKLGEKVQNRFSLNFEEIEEVLLAYGTDALPRKEGHVVSGIIYNFLAPVIDEIRSLELRQSEHGLPVMKKIFVTGNVAQYDGVVEDISRMTFLDTQSADIWDGVVDLKAYIPQIHKKDSYEYVGIAGLMNIIKNGTLYKPFDL